MSMEALTWAKGVKAGSPSAKAVLWVVADAAGDNGVTYISQDTIAERCEIARETVLRALKMLEAANLIIRTKRYDDRGYRASDLITLALGDAQSLSKPDLGDAGSLSDPCLSDAVSPSEARLCDFNASAYVTQRHSIPLTNPIKKDISSLAKPESKPQKRIKTPIDPEFESAYRAYPHFRGRTDKAASYREWQKLTPDDRITFGMAVAAFAGSSEATRDDHQFVPAMERWLRKAQWRDYATTMAGQPEAAEIDWDARLAKFQQTGAWVSSWGEKPGREGCAASPDVLQRHGFGPKSAVIIPIQRNETNAA